ncbi:MAG TPA: hypothetical protein VHX44_10945 [Planctomycetota bacterium]|nr:hypothetical protein [Planctomycetota bacterium]
MTVHVGNTIWDRSTGAITPPQTGVERKANNDGSVKLKNTARIAEPEGQVITTRTLANEADAILLAQLAGLMQGQRVTISLDGAIFTGVRVDSVSVNWPKVRAPGQREFLCTAVWTFGPTSPDNHDDPKERLVPSKVETCRVWGEWVEQKHLCATSCNEVFGPIGSLAGNALVIQVLNPAAVTEHDEPDSAGRLPADVLGHWIRISLPEGAPEVIAKATTFTPAFHGRITNRSIGDDNSRVTVAFTCLDLSCIFDTWLLSWYELNDDGIVADGTTIPPFNAVVTGERSSATAGPDDTYVHDRTRTAGLEWRNGDIARLLIAAFKAQFPTGPQPVLGGQTNALDNFQSHDFDGASLREQLGQIICRGIGCRFVVDPTDGRTVTIHLNTGIKTALTAGAWTVPANDRQTTVDLHNLADRVGWNLDEDASQVADVIAFEFGCPWYCVSLGITQDNDRELLFTWTEGEGTGWDDLTETQRDNADQCHIWRRFRLDKDWVGASYKVHPHTIDVGRTKATNATNGTQGENGEYSATGNNRFPWAAVRFTKSLPLTMGTDWSGDMSSGGPGLKQNAAQERPTAYLVKNPGGSEEWTRLDMELTIDDDQPAVILGRDAKDAKKIRDWLKDGKHIVLTLGFRLPRPWRMTWRRDPAERLCDQERTVVYQRPDIDYRFLMDQTVVGIKADKTASLSGEGVIGDKPAVAAQLLGLGRLTHERTQRGLTWTRQRIDLSADTAPGAFITDATLPYGVDADLTDKLEPAIVRTVDEVIGVRGWNLDREKPATSWSTIRLAADVVLRPKPASPPLTMTNAAAMVYSQ